MTYYTVGALERTIEGAPICTSSRTRATMTLVTSIISVQCILLPRSIARVLTPPLTVNKTMPWTSK